MEIVERNILDGEHLDNLAGALAGNISGSSKAKGGGCCASLPRYSFTSMSYASKVLSCVRRGKRRKGRTMRLPKLTMATIRPGPDPPAGRRGWLERGAHMLLLRRKITEDCRYAQTVLCRSYASEYFSDNLYPLPGAVSSRQILPTSPPHKCLGGHNKDDD